MAIAFNLPSEREANEENYSRLNRLLAELYDVLCHILVSRQSPESENLDSNERRRDRPYSESDYDRNNRQLPDIPILNTRRRSANCHIPPLNLDDIDDDVFVSPRDGNNPFSPRTVGIFGSNALPRTPAGVLLTPRLKYEKRFIFPSVCESALKDKGGTDEADGIMTIEACDNYIRKNGNADSVSDGSLFSTLFQDKLSSAGSICTALIFIAGWKYFTKTQ